MIHPPITATLAAPTGAAPGRASALFIESVVCKTRREMCDTAGSDPAMEPSCPKECGARKAVDPVANAKSRTSLPIRHKLPQLRGRAISGFGPPRAALY